MKPWFFAASIETVITLLIFVGLSVLSTWIKNRNAGKSADDLPPPPLIPRRGQPNRPAQPARGQKPASWEEELRRLLEGESPAAPPPQPILVERRAPEPPPLRPTPVAQRPSPFTASRRAVAEEEESAEGGGLAVDMPTLSQAASTQAYASQIDDRAGKRLRQGGAFAAANASHVRASQLHELTAARMRHVTEQTPSMMAVKTRDRHGAEGVRVGAMLRNRATIRTAIVASIVLGQPKATEF